jgi:hypothetical protein
MCEWISTREINAYDHIVKFSRAQILKRCGARMHAVTVDNERL